MDNIKQKYAQQNYTDQSSKRKTHEAVHRRNTDISLDIGQTKTLTKNFQWRSRYRSKWVATLAPGHIFDVRLGRFWSSVKLGENFCEYWKNISKRGIIITRCYLIVLYYAYFGTLVLFHLARKIQDYRSKMSKIFFYSLKIRSRIFIKNLFWKSLEFALRDLADTLYWRISVGIQYYLRMRNFFKDSEIFQERFNWNWKWVICL